jgi:prepilin-type processing-associated H-X9-DG protein
MLIAEYLRGTPQSDDARGMFWTFQAGGGCLFARYTPNSSSRDILVSDENWCSSPRGHNQPGMNLPCRKSTSPGWNDTTAAARSLHPGGVNILLADGSVRFISENIDVKIWRAFATIANEEVFNTSDI